MTHLPLVGRSKSRSEAKRFRVGGALCPSPPPEKCFAFFDLPTRGRLKNYAAGVCLSSFIRAR